ncbi:MAG: ferredoxin [bacterium]|nr:ferredoxin [Deltaproteobacteria bacterium]MCP4907481.1 ferredoxin [bacterium]
MKVLVDTDLCEANALCMEACPEVFRVEEDDTLTLLMQEVPEVHRAAMKDAERLCPRQAIRLEG